MLHNNLKIANQAPCMDEHSTVMSKIMKIYLDKEDFSTNLEIITNFKIINISRYLIFLGENCIILRYLQFNFE